MTDKTESETDIVELEAPDISPYKSGNTGVDYITTFESGKPGPHVMISAVVHGNELCGAIALDHLLRHGVRPLAGKLSLAFMNVDAFHSFDPDNPRVSRFVDEDFNRLWGHDVLEGDRDSVECRRAREVWPIVDTVDYLLDIHSMQNINEPLMMAGPMAKGREFAREIKIPRVVVTDAGHKAGKRMRDYAPFIDPNNPRNALLVECGQHWEKMAADVAIEASYRFLGHFNMVSGEDVEAHIINRNPPEQRFIEVSGPETITTDDFSFTETFAGMEVIPKAGTVIGRDGNREIKTPFDDCVLIMPSKRLRKGESAVRYGRYLAQP